MVPILPSNGRVSPKRHRKRSRLPRKSALSLSLIHIYFTDQFLGRAAEPLTIDDIDAVTGATISSKAALAAVNEAIEAYRSAAGEAPAAAATSAEKGAA